MGENISMFIIDFDDTLFNTHAFKQARVEALRKLGVTEEIYKKSYQEAYNNSAGINIYNNKSHAEVLQQYGFKKEDSTNALNSITLKKYLFPDAIDFLTFLKQLQQKLTLLSLGEESFQKMKISGAGIESWFDYIFTVNDSKENIIKQILQDNTEEKQIWFINDKIEETEKLVTIFSQLRPILKMSPIFSEEQYKSSGIPYFSTLTEIKHYVEQQLG